uniref:WNK3 n=1 Tax=Arundo donax TaxID=35708 RepID=A0A0A9GRW7_ARUDO
MSTPPAATDGTRRFLARVPSRRYTKLLINWKG